jgi:putative endonuclease
MAAVYILYSELMDKYYVGSCKDINIRLNEHKQKEFKKAFTRRVDDWALYYIIDNLEYQQARLIEGHIKRMKSKKYIENLKQYPEIVERLKDLYM